MDHYQRNLLQRWEVYGSVVHVVALLADHLVRCELQQASGKHHSSVATSTATLLAHNHTSSMTNTSAATNTLDQNGSNATSASTTVPLRLTTEGVQPYLAACALYLHALSIVRTFLASFDLPEDSNPPPEVGGFLLDVRLWSVLFGSTCFMSYL